MFNESMEKCLIVKLNNIITVINELGKDGIEALYKDFISKTKQDYGLEELSNIFKNTSMDLQDLAYSVSNSINVSASEVELAATRAERKKRRYLPLYVGQTDNQVSTYTTHNMNGTWWNNEVDRHSWVRYDTPLYINEEEGEKIIFACKQSYLNLAFYITNTLFSFYTKSIVELTEIDVVFLDKRTNKEINLNTADAYTLKAYLLLRGILSSVDFMCTDAHVRVDSSNCVMLNKIKQMLEFIIDNMKFSQDDIENICFSLIYTNWRRTISVISNHVAIAMHEHVYNKLFIFNNVYELLGRFVNNGDPYASFYLDYFKEILSAKPYKEKRKVFSKLISTTNDSISAISLLFDRYQDYRQNKLSPINYKKFGICSS